jgi:hypothetical protein
MTMAMNPQLSSSDADTDATSFKDNKPEMSPESLEKPVSSLVRPNVKTEITKQVIRKKFVKQRHLIVEKAFDPDYLDSLFPQLLEIFDPQTVYYNGGVANVPEWKISCYLEVMPDGVPTADPNLALLHLFSPLLHDCNDLFLHWYKQQHACNNLNKKLGRPQDLSCERIMTFVTRYTPAPGEQALLKHVDGAGKVDGSIVVALPMEAGKEFDGGGLRVWDGKDANGKTLETHYDTRSGDVAFIDR